MPAAEQVVQFPFSSGIDEKTEAELVELPTLLRADNAVQNKRGCMQKRRGNVALSAVSGANAASFAQAGRLLSLQNELVLTDGHQLFGRTAGAGWFARDRVPEPIASLLPVANLGVDATVFGLQPPSVEVAVNSNGYAAVAYYAPNSTGSAFSLFAAIVEIASGAFVLPPTQLSINDTPIFRLCAVGSIFFLASVSSGSNSMAIQYWDTNTSGAWLGIGTSPVAADVFQGPGGAVFDMVGLTDRFTVVYVNTSGAAASVSLKTFQASAAGTLLDSATIAAGAVQPVSVAIGGSQADITWVGWNTGGTTNFLVEGHNPTNLASVTATSVTVFANATNACLSWTSTGAGNAVGYSFGGGLFTTVWRQFAKSGGATVLASSPGSATRLVPTSKPWTDGTRHYCMARYASSVNGSQGMAWCVDVTAQTLGIRPVCAMTPRLSTPGLWLGSIGLRSATKILVPNIVTRSAVGAVIQLVTLDFANPARHQGCAFGDMACLGGGVPSTYDGMRVSEIGFQVVPETPTGIAGGGAGLNGDYQWTYIYEQVDVRGNVHRSAPATPLSLHVGAGNSGVITMGTLQVTTRYDIDNKTGPVRIVPYRTTNGGTTFYRCSGLERINDPTVDTITVTDSIVDATLSTKALLYTQPSAGATGNLTAQPRKSPPQLTSLIPHQDRLFGLDPDGNVWFTGQRVIGEGPWTCDLFQLPVGTGTKANALASLDGHIIVFKPEPVIAYIDGDGPPDTGIGGDFSAPRFIPTDVGCINPLSVVVTPLGVFFQSTRGIELLSRSLQVEEFFGRPVESTLNAFPFISSAVLKHDLGRVVFTCLTAAGSGSGVKIVFDLVQGLWTVDKNAAGAICAVEAGVASPAYYWADAQSSVYQESASAFTDAGTWAPLVLETGELKLGGRSGYQHVTQIILSGKQLSAHDLTIEVAYDGGAYVDTFFFPASALQGVDREELKCAVSQPLSQSIRVRITDAAPTGIVGDPGNGQGPAFYSIGFSVGVEPGLARRPAGSQK